MSTLTLPSLARSGTGCNLPKMPFGQRFLWSDQLTVLYFRQEKTRSAAVDTEENTP